MTDLREAFPVEAVESPERFSQTFLAKSDVCPFSGYLYLRYGGGVASHALIRGSAFHDLAERWVSHLIENELNVGETEEVKGMLDAVLRGYDEPIPAHEQDGLRVMAHHLAEGTWIDPATVVAVEDKFDVEIAGRTVTGKIDLAMIDGARGAAHDYKTAFHIPDQATFEGKFQLPLYAVTFSEGTIRGETFGLGSGLTEFELREIYPRHFWDAEGTMAYRSMTIDYAAILDHKLYLERLVERTERALAASAYHAIPGAHCSECPAASECPLPARLRSWQGELTVASPIEDAQAVATRWFFKKGGPKSSKSMPGTVTAEDPGGSIDADWKALKAWTSENGSLRFGADLILEWTTVEKGDVRKSKKEVFRAAVEAAVERGVPFVWEDHFKNQIETRLSLRSLSPHELEAEQETADGGAAEDG